MDDSILLVETKQQAKETLEQIRKFLKDKVKTLQEKVKLGKISSKEAKKFLAGHYGYIKIANTYNLEQKLFPATFTEY